MLKELATRLCAMKTTPLDRLGLADELRASIATAQAIRSAPARNRQVNVVRQHLRALGPALDALVRRLDAPTKGGSVPAPDAVAGPASPEVTEWSNRLAEEGDTALEEFLLVRPEADRQRLRQRMRDLSRARANAPAATARTAEERLRELVATSWNI